MFIIVLHHYCVNSGFVELINPKILTGNMLFVQFMSIGGKVGVNIFFLISGYFMINSSMKWRKVFQLVFQILSINILVCIFLSAIGYSYGFKDYLKIIPLIFDVPESFISNYIVVYLLSPFINKALKSFNKKEYSYLLLVLLIYFCMLHTFFNQKTWHYMGWAFTMYCVGAYIRKYDLSKLNWHFGWISIGFVILTWVEILLLDFIVFKFDKSQSIWCFAIGDANKINIFLLAVSIFLYFLRLNIRCIKSVNYVGGGGIAFGVLLWHANNDIMRQWLWKDFLKNTEYLTHDYLWLHCLLSVVSVYVICTMLELLRYYFIERPIFSKIKGYKKVNV